MDWRLELAQHAAQREAARVHRELSCGLVGLATVAATAPWLGLLWTVWGIVFYVFRGCPCGDQSTWLAAIAGGLSRSLPPTEFGLGLAIVTTWGHRHFRAQLTRLDLEMRVAAEALPELIAAGRHRN